MQRTHIGKYLLDSISFGMYDQALMAIREYVQNSADAIDAFRRNRSDSTQSRGIVDITISGRNRSITIRDDGTGVPASKAWHVLHDLGNSEKNPGESRGFRGIGRLGGLGYCDELRFTTKAERESLVSCSTWDCRKLRQSINEDRDLRDAAQVVQDVVTFQQKPHSGSIEDHFFQVEMTNVKSSRDVLLDVPAVKAYLSQVAPVPFCTEAFRFAQAIDETLRTRVPTYQTYCMRVNGETIQKPYADSVRIAQDRYEEVGGWEPIELADDDSGLLAFGWRLRLDFVGSIQSSSLVDGLRVRRGNIQIGKKDLLAEFFNETRFNNYLVGELHIVNPQLVPNTRRDDFEDNAVREILYSCFLREIGKPYSRRIREASEVRNSVKRTVDVNTYLRLAATTSEIGYCAKAQQEKLLGGLRQIADDPRNCALAEQIQTTIGMVERSMHVLDKKNGALSDEAKSLLKNVFETIFEEASQEGEAQRLVERILESLPSSRLDRY